VELAGAESLPVSESERAEIHFVELSVSVSIAGVLSTLAQISAASLFATAFATVEDLMYPAKRRRNRTWPQMRIYSYGWNGTSPIVMPTVEQRK
jgi:hypothetical protein